MIKFTWLNPFKHDNKYYGNILFGISWTYTSIEKHSQKNFDTYEFEYSETINIAFYFIVPFLNVDIEYVKKPGNKIKNIFSHDSLLEIFFLILIVLALLLGIVVTYLNITR